MKNNMTHIQLLKQIRLACDLPIHSKKWFTREEIKKICIKINRGACFISNNKTKQSYLNNQQLFPKYVKGWQEQVTDNVHPSTANLMAIYNSVTVSKNMIPTGSATTNSTIPIKNKPLHITATPKLPKTAAVKKQPAPIAQQLVKNGFDDVEKFLNSIPPNWSSRVKSIELTDSKRKITINLI